MKYFSLRYLLVFVLFIVGIYYVLNLSSDELRIRKNIREIAGLAEISSGEHPFVRLKTAKQLSNFIAETLTIQFKAKEAEREPVIIDKKRILEQKIVLVRSYLKYLKIVLQSVDVEVSGERAKARLVVNAYGKFAQKEGEFFDRHLIEIEFKKEAEDWKVFAAAHLENLRGEVE